MAEGDCWISWTTPDGETMDEQWPNIDAFLSWAAGEGLSGTYRAYEEDEDGDRLFCGSGRI